MKTLHAIAALALLAAPAFAGDAFKVEAHPHGAVAVDMPQVGSWVLQIPPMGSQTLTFSAASKQGEMAKSILVRKGDTGETFMCGKPVSERKFYEELGRAYVKTNGFHYDGIYNPCGDHS